MFGFWGYDPYAGACPNFKEALRKFIAVGDLDQAASDHLDLCPTCTAIIDRLKSDKQ